MNKSIIAMIPARIGSTRLEFKNLALIDGKPLIYYAINAAKKSKMFDKIVLNSDHEIFSEIAKRYKIDFFLRSKNLGSNDARSDDVVLDFGCGESPKDQLAEAVSELFLFGDADEISKRLSYRYKDSQNINIVYDLEATTSFSTILIHSVIQYLSKEEFIDKLKYFRSKMVPGFPQ